MQTFLRLVAILEFLDEKLSEVLGELSYTDYLILKELVTSETPQTPTSLARAVNKVPTSFTPVLDRLEKKKFLKRYPNKLDRRSVRIKPTNRPKIEALIAELEPKVEEVLNKYLLPEERALISSMYMRIYPVD